MRRTGARPSATALTVVARSLPDVRYEEYGFEGGACLGFPSRYDVHGERAEAIRCGVAAE